MRESTFILVNKVASVAAGALASGTIMMLGGGVKTYANKMYYEKNPPKYIGKPKVIGTGVKWIDTSTGHRARIKPDQFKLGPDVVNGTMGSSKYSRNGIYYIPVDHGFDTTAKVIDIGTGVVAAGSGIAVSKLVNKSLTTSEWYKSFSDSKERSANINAVDDDEEDEESLNKWAEEL